MTRLFPEALQDCSDQILKVLVILGVVMLLICQCVGHCRRSPPPTHNARHIVTLSVVSTTVRLMITQGEGSHDPTQATLCNSTFINFDWLITLCIYVPQGVLRSSYCCCFSLHTLVNSSLEHLLKYWTDYALDVHVREHSIHTNFRGM